MIKLPTQAFMEKYGKYDYYYTTVTLEENPENWRDKVQYWGETSGGTNSTRCLDHIKDPNKKYKFENLYLWAYNLEKFDSRPQKLTETLRELWNPSKDNKQNGIHAECFIPIRLADKWNEYLLSQRDMGKDMTDIVYHTHTEYFTKDKRNTLYAVDSYYEIESNPVNNIYFKIREEKNVGFIAGLRINDKSKFDTLLQSHFDKNYANEYSIHNKTSDRISFKVDSFEKCLDLWENHFA